MDAAVAYFGYKRAAELGFKLALCGEGSDEVLAGYDLFSATCRSASFGCLISELVTCTVTSDIQQGVL